MAQLGGKMHFKVSWIERRQHCEYYLCLSAEPDGEGIDNALEIAHIGEDKSKEDCQKGRLGYPLEKQVDVGRRTNDLSFGILEEWVENRKQKTRQYMSFYQ